MEEDRRLKPSALFDRAPALISVHEGRRHVYLYANDRTAWVADGRRLLGRPLSEAVPEFEGQGIVERFDAAFRTGEAQRAAEILVRLPERAGRPPRIRWYSHLVEPWHDDGGAVAGVMSFAFDVTEQVLARQAAQESEARLHRFLDAMISFAARLTPEGTLVQVNASALATAGLSAEAVIGQPFWQTHWWTYDSAVEDRMRRAVRAAAAGKPMRYDETIRAKGEERIVVDVALMPERDEAGEVVSIVVSGMDVTERVRAEAALADSEARFRVITDAVPQLVWGADAGGTIDYRNERLERFLGIDDAAAKEMTWTDLVHPDDRSAAASAWAAAQVVGGPFETEYRLRHHTGQYRWVLARALPLTDGGRVTRWLGTCTDIDRIKTTEMHRKLLVDELNHRVKNTLAVVQSFAHQTFSEEQPDSLRTFEGRLSALASAHDLLTQEAWEKASLHDLVHNALDSTGVDPARYAVSGPRVVLPPKTAVTIAMAMHELATNAIKYGALSTASGHVSVVWRRYRGAGGSRLGLVWTERDGPPVRAPTDRGFGSRMIEFALASELRGEATLDFAADGLVCTLDAPLPAVKRKTNWAHSGPRTRVS